MIVSAEISLYPLEQDFIPVIDDFLACLRAKPNISVRVNALSTQIRGEYREVMNILTDCMEQSLNQKVKMSFVLKVLNTDIEEFYNDLPGN